MNLPLKVDKLDKYDKCIKKLRENFEKIGLKKRSKRFFDSGVLFCKPFTIFKKFHWPVKIVKLKRMTKKSKNLKTIENCKLYLKNSLQLQN